MTWLMLMIAALDAEYVSQPDRPLIPAVDATLTMSWKVFPRRNSSWTMVKGA